MSSPVIMKLESFGRISDDDRGRLDQIVAIEAKDFPARTDVIKEGDNPDCAHLLTEGMACRYKLLRNGGRQIVAFLLPGDFCDLHSFIMRSTDHSIGTLTPSKIAEISKQDVDDILSRPTLARPMLMSTLVDEATLRAWIVTLGQMSATERCAHLFCELHARLYRVGLADGSSFKLPFVQSDLADTLGLSLVHMNRTMKELREANLLLMKGKNVTIPDISKLRDCCNFKPNYLHLGERPSDWSAGPPFSAAR